MPIPADLWARLAAIAAILIAAAAPAQALDTYADGPIELPAVASSATAGKTPGNGRVDDSECIRTAGPGGFMGRVGLECPASAQQPETPQPTSSAPTQR